MCDNVSFFCFFNPFYRAILESIERELRGGNGRAPASNPGVHLLAPAAASAVSLTPETTEKAGEPAKSLSPRPSSPHASPQTETETMKKVSSAGSARSHPLPGRTRDGDPRWRRRQAALIQRSTGRSSARPNGSSDNSGKPIFDGDGSNHSSNRKGPPGVNCRPHRSGKPMLDGSIHRSNRKGGSDVAPCQRLTRRTVSAKRGGDGGTRSTGTVVAHFPTAVAATVRSKTREKAAASRSRR